MAENVREFLRGLLADGPVASKRIRAAAEKAGHAWRTVQRAQKAMDIEAYRDGFGKAGVWYWRLVAGDADAKSAKETKQRHTGNVAKADPTESEPKVRGIRRAELAAQPSANAGMVIAEFTIFRDLDVTALVDHLKDGMSDVSKNDLSGCEAMLYYQAHALEAIFVGLAHRAQQDWTNNYEGFMRLALKAQNQCRMTLETLAQIKNPPVVFARQANIAQGPQQVNNAMMPAGEPRAGAGKNETENGPSQLLEAKPHERLDTGTTRPASGADPQLATLGAIDRAAYRRG